MEIEDTPLYREARDIMANGSTNTHFGWRVMIHYGDNQVLKPLKCVALNNVRDYAKAFTDVTTLSVDLGLGKYAWKIYPNREKLQVTLFKLPQKEGTEDGNGDTPIEAERFSATLIDQDRSPREAQGSEAMDEEAMDLTQIVTLHFQLYNKSLEQVRMISVGGIFRDCKIDTLLQSMLTKESQKADVDAERAIVGVDMVPVSNKDKHPQVVITHGTKLVDLPDFLQKRIGVYSAGMGSYIQNKYWHLFPLYDTTTFNERQQTLTLIVLPRRKFTDADRTYRKVGDSMTILMTGETAFKDDSGTDYLKEGNGARFNDAGTIMENVSTNKDNKAVISRARNANEVMTEKRPDGINHVPMATQRITSNPFPVYSALASRKGGLFKGVWQNSDPKLLLPGMVARILYNDEGETKEMYGVLHGCEHVSRSVGDIASEKFTTTSVLYLFVNKAVPDA